MTKVLIFRFSAMGDVAMVMAALKQVMLQNPTVEFYVLTRKKFFPFFENHTQIKLINADFEGIHKGLGGLFSLSQELRNLKIDYVLDLHQNLRTTILKALLSFSSGKIFTLDKGRKEKKKLTNKQEFKPLKHGIERYLEVFINAKIIKHVPISEKIIPVFKTAENASQKIETYLKSLKSQKIVAIAPFAQHAQKMWPIEKYEEIIKSLDAKKTQTLVFGGGQKEKEIGDALAKKYNFCENIIAKFSLEEEIALLAKVDVLVCNDSSNMHIASLMGTKTVSIWGATHPFAGFGVLFQPLDNQIQISKETLSCRPCSIYGNKPCVRGDLACLNWIETKDVLANI